MQGRRRWRSGWPLPSARSEKARRRGASRQQLVRRAVPVKKRDLMHQQPSARIHVRKPHSLLRCSCVPVSGVEPDIKQKHQWYQRAPVREVPCPDARAVNSNYRRTAQIERRNNAYSLVTAPHEPCMPTDCPPCSSRRWPPSGLLPTALLLLSSRPHGLTASRLPPPHARRKRRPPLLLARRDYRRVLLHQVRVHLAARQLESSLRNSPRPGRRARWHLLRLTARLVHPCRQIAPPSPSVPPCQDRDA